MVETLSQGLVTWRCGSFGLDTILLRRSLENDQTRPGLSFVGKPERNFCCSGIRDA